MISTPRLHIIPLSYDQLQTYLQANNLLEAALGLKKTNRTISKDVKEMVEKLTLPKIQESSAADFIFYTFWIVVEKSSGIIVAELGFKGPPNEEAAIEIGYGTMPGYENNGYMTEAVAGMLDWARQRTDIAAVLASIDENNKASLKIMEKNNFIFVEKKNGLLWWKKKVDSLV